MGTIEKCFLNLIAKKQIATANTRAKLVGMDGKPMKFPGGPAVSS
jgi:hypothetical protein